MTPDSPTAARTPPEGTTDAITPATSRYAASTRWAWVVLALVLLANGYVRWRFLEVPLERDEGEFVYIAERMLDGEPPYKSGHAMKMPGIYVAYALAISCFGHTVRGIHLGLAVANSLSIVFLFLITRRLYGQWVAIVAAGMFALLALDPEVNGAAAQAEPFVLLPALLGVWLLQVIFARASERNPAAPRPSLAGLVGAGVCFGTAAIVKQHGFVFCLFAAWMVVWNWWCCESRSVGVLAARLAALAVGGLLPFLTTAALLSYAGAFDEFWFWTVTYSRSYVTETTWDRGLRRLLRVCGALGKTSGIIWVLALLGLSALFWDRLARTGRALVLPLLVFSLLGVFPGLHFRGHYFVFVLPATAILAALACQALVNLVAPRQTPSTALSRSLALLGTGLVFIAATVAWQRQYLLLASPAEVSRMIYKVEPFEQTVEVANYIVKHSQETGPIMVLGSEPQIYFYTGRIAASPHIYMYPLMEIHPYAHQMQQEVAQEITATHPEWIVFEMHPGGWLRRPGSDPWILSWAAQVLDKYYERVGLIDFSTEETKYVWNKEMAAIDPNTPHWLALYRRKDAPSKKSGD